jgi:hypothetical protein
VPAVAVVAAAAAPDATTTSTSATTAARVRLKPQGIFIRHGLLDHGPT